MNSAHQTLLNWLKKETLFGLVANSSSNVWLLHLEECSGWIAAEAVAPSWEAACYDLCQQLRAKNLL